MRGIDIETASPDGGGLLDVHTGRIRLVQISDGERTDVYDLDHVNADEVRAAIEEHEELVAHNAPFERTWIAAKLGIDLPQLHDTLVMSKVFYTGTNYAKRRMSHKLESVVERELKKEMDKDEQTSDWNAEPLTRAQLEYAERDAGIMPELADKLMGKLTRVGLKDVYDLERRVTFAVDAMERNGFAVNVEKLAPLVEESTEAAERLKAELTEAWGINPGSSKQLIEKFELEDREDWPKTPAGAPSANQDAMRLLLDEDPTVATWMEWKRVEKLRSTYGKSLQDSIVNGRIHARFDPFGAATGRFSSSGPNLQNIPKDPRYRSLFWSGSDDRVLVKADYASIGLWLAAVRWRDPYMQDALQQGVNMHVATAAALFNVKPGEVTKEQNSQTHHERFPGLERALKAPLTAFFGVVDPLGIGDAQRLLLAASASVHEVMVRMGQYHRKPL